MGSVFCCLMMPAALAAALHLNLACLLPCGSIALVACRLSLAGGCIALVACRSLAAALRLNLACRSLAGALHLSIGRSSLLRLAFA